MSESNRAAPESDVTLVITTVPSADVASTIARTLLEDRLIACANVLPGVRSLYRWEGKVRDDDEVLVLMKTTRATYPRMEASLVRAHPYDVPEIMAVPVSSGFAPYLEWVASEAGGIDV